VFKTLGVKIFFSQKDPESVKLNEALKRFYMSHLASEAYGEGRQSLRVGGDNSL